jgi:SAM-dependent methyltransferase
MPAVRHRPEPPPVDFEALYDAHPEYVARREAGSFERAQIDLEVGGFKVPHLLRLLAADAPLRSAVEIGCATGELIAALPVLPPGRRLGIDISAANVAVAAARHPGVEFLHGDLRSMGATIGGFDAVVLSDVREHVDDDAGLLRAAAALGERILVNLPLEHNLLNVGRAYGPADVSGHLRRYRPADGLALFERAGLQVVAHERVWIHETPVESARRELRRRQRGQAYSGGWLARTAKRGLYAGAVALPALGRRLFPSNLFVLACKRPAP